MESTSFDSDWTLEFNQRLETRSVELEFIIDKELTSDTGSASNWIDFYYPRGSQSYTTRSDAETARDRITNNSLINVVNEDGSFLVTFTEGNTVL